MENPSGFFIYIYSNIKMLLKKYYKEAFFETHLRKVIEIKRKKYNFPIRYKL